MSSKKQISIVYKIVILVIIGVVPYFILLSRHIINSDPFYWKTTHRAENLIIGDSRIQKGIAPFLLKEHSGTDKDWLNIAFTGLNSPYGEAYNNFIKRKLKKPENGRSAQYILGVQPGMIMEYSKFQRRREDDFRIYQLWTVNQHPNLEYIIRNVNANRPLLNEMLFRSEKQITTYKDGWVEYNGQINNPQLFRGGRIFDKRFVKSEYREEKLVELVDYLLQYGKVYLVRLPIDVNLSNLEDEHAPYFKDFMIEIASRKDVYYLDYSSVGDQFEYYDFFHHLNGQGARAFTTLLAMDISQLK